MDAIPSETTTADRKRVLIVDDSRAIRSWLRTVLASDRRLDIVGEASDAIQARDFLKAHAADVLTLDIEMPGMSGLEFLTRLMRARPMPVVMLSSLTSKGSEAAVQALSRGAIDCILKPTDGFDHNLSRDICERVYQAACTRPAHVTTRLHDMIGSSGAVKKSAPAYGMVCRRGSLVLIGASTGGVSALEAVLPELGPQGAPVVIVQHMPGNFLESFAERLQRYLPQNVQLVEENRVLRRGDVVLAPGRGRHTHVRRGRSGWTCTLRDDTDNNLHCPSVDELFSSAVPEAKNVTAAILTGLGKDGAKGMLALREAGATTLGQDEHTSVVYGMPRVAHTLGGVQKQLPIDKMGMAIRELSGKTRAISNTKKIYS